MTSYLSIGSVLAIFSFTARGKMIRLRTCPMENDISASLVKI